MMRLILVLGSTSQNFSITSQMEAKNYPQREKRRLTRPWLSLAMGLSDVPSLSRAIRQPAIREPSSLLLACARLSRDSCPSLPAGALWARFSRRRNRSAPRGTSAKYEQEKLGRYLPRVAQAKGFCTLAFLCTSFCAAVKPALFVNAVVKKVSIVHADIIAQG
jgi:hypothetical protein